MMSRELKEHVAREHYRGRVHMAAALAIFTVSLPVLCWLAYWIGTTI